MIHSVSKNDKKRKEKKSSMITCNMKNGHMFLDLIESNLTCFGAATLEEEVVGEGGQTRRYRRLLEQSSGPSIAIVG